MSDYNKYGSAAIKSMENFSNKVLLEINKSLPDSGLKLLNLVEIIPNWETYLTDKQLESTKEYIKHLSASEVDYRLGLRIGTTQQRLFGTISSKGALGRLEEIKDRLDKQGYFEHKKTATQKAQKRAKNAKPTKISDKTKEQIKELFFIISQVPNYKEYLMPSQIERLEKFLELKSVKSCAKYFGITEVTFKQSLFGRSYDSGILGKLRKVYESTTVNKWSDL